MTSRSVRVESSYRRVVSFVGILCLVLYSTFGLGFGAVKSVSMLGFVFAFLGFLSLILYSFGIPRFLRLYFFIVAYVASSWLWAKDPSIASFGQYLTASLGGMLLAGAIYYRWITFKQCILILLIPVVLNGYAYMVGDNTYAELYDVNEEDAFKRFAGYAGHANSLVTRLIAPLVVFGLLYPLGQSSEVRRRWWGGGMLLVVILAAAFGVFASGSKKSLLLAAAGGAIVMLQARLHGRRSGGGRYFLLFVLLCFGAIASSYLAEGVFDLEIFQRFDSFLSGDDESTKERQLLVLLSPSLIVQAPFFGHGLDQYAVVSRMGIYSHNNIVELLVNTGFFGFLLYYSVFFYLLARVYRTERSWLHVALLVFLFLFLDFTGVTYGDRGSQVIFSAFYVSAFLFGRSKA